LLDCEIVAVFRPRRNCPKLGRIFRSDDPEETTCLIYLNRPARHQHRILDCRQQNPGPDELTRDKPLVVIIEMRQ
jgi:hypothetical protein